MRHLLTTPRWFNERLKRAGQQGDRGGLSLEWLLVAGFLVVAAGAVAIAYGNRITALIATLG